MIELTSRLPRNSSRTSTQAISVPITALIATTISDEITVSLIAATRLRVADRVPEVPEPIARSPRLTTAARGSSTIRLIQRIAAPRVSAAPPRVGREGPPSAVLATAVSADAIWRSLQLA